MTALPTIVQEKLEETQHTCQEILTDDELDELFAKYGVQDERTRKLVQLGINRPRVKVPFLPNCLSISGLAITMGLLTPRNTSGTMFFLAEGVFGG